MTSQSDQKPKVIGIYGLPGSGKTTLRKILEYRHALDHIKMFEGSETLQDVLPPGVRLSVMDEDEKILKAIPETQLDGNRLFLSLHN